MRLKKVKYGLIMVLTAFFFSVILIGNTFAAIDLNGVSIFMTDLNSSTPKDIFNLGETPYLYFGFPSSFDNWLKIESSVWKDPDGQYSGLTVGLTSLNNSWYSLSDWDTVKKEGFWEVDAGYLAAKLFGLKVGGDKLSFNYGGVAPEPVSSALFLFGGGALALRMFRKRKKV